MATNLISQRYAYAIHVENIRGGASVSTFPYPYENFIMVVVSPRETGPESLKTSFRILISVQFGTNRRSIGDVGRIDGNNHWNGNHKSPWKTSTCLCPLHVSSGPSNDKSPEWRQDMAGVAVQKGFTVVLDMPLVHFSGFTGVCVQHLYNALVNETHRLTVKKIQQPVTWLCLSQCMTSQWCNNSNLFMTINIRVPLVVTCFTKCYQSRWYDLENYFWKTI